MVLTPFIKSLKKGIKTQWHLVCITLWWLVIASLNILAYFNYHLFDRDFYSTAQVIWKLSQWELPVTTIFNQHFLGNHFNVIYAVIAPLYALIPWPPLLLLLSTTATATGLLVWKKIISVPISSAPIRALIWIGMLLNPLLWLACIGRVNADAYAFLFISLCIWAITNERWRYVFLWTTLALLCKEDIGLYMIGLSAWVCLKHRKIGLWMATLSGVGLCTAFGSMSIFKSNLTHNNALISYNYLEHGFSSLLTVEGVHGFFSQLASTNTLWGLGVGLFFGLLWLPFSGTSILVIILPLLTHFGSSRFTMALFLDHHSWVVLPFIWLTTVYGIRKGITIIQTRYTVKESLAIVGGIIAFSVVLYPIVIGITIKKSGYPIIAGIHRQETHTSYTSALKLIPKNAPVLAENILATHLPNRSKIYELNPYSTPSLDFVLEHCDWIVLDMHRTIGDDRRQHKIMLSTALSFMRSWKVVFAEKGVVVFQSADAISSGDNSNVTGNESKTIVNGNRSK